ncbi:hypothetical protein U9M48_021731, partial [Paspalum notatum var. saurae]
MPKPCRRNIQLHDRTRRWGGEHPQMMPELTSNADDDEGVIFEEDDEDDEVYLFAGQEEDTDEENNVEETQDDSSSIPDILDPAKKFEYEPPGFCCRNGKIDLAPQTTCDELM